MFSIPRTLPVNQLTDDGIDDDCRDLAARLIAARFGLPQHVARVVCSLAGLGTSEVA
jgi:hypothetical protein